MLIKRLSFYFELRFLIWSSFITFGRHFQGKKKVNDIESLFILCFNCICYKKQLLLLLLLFNFHDTFLSIPFM